MNFWSITITDTCRGKRGARSRRYLVQAESADDAKRVLLQERPDVIAYAQAWVARPWDYLTYMVDSTQLTQEAAQRMYERNGEGFENPSITDATPAERNEVDETREQPCRISNGWCPVGCCTPVKNN